MTLVCLEQRFIGEVTCDACGNVEKIDVHTEAEARQKLTDEGWETDKGNWICPTCAHEHNEIDRLLGIVDDNGNRLY
jgi:hypothetical protein